MRRPFTVSGTAHLEEVRSKVASLLRCDSRLCAVMPSTSYAVSLAAKLFGPIGVAIVARGEMDSVVLPWQSSGIKLVVVDCLTTETLHDAIVTHHQQGCCVAVSHYHWTQGSSFDLDSTLRLCDRLGVPVVLDLTQSLGVVPYDFSAVSPALRMMAACSVHKHLYGMHGSSVCFLSEALLASSSHVSPLELHSHQLLPQITSVWDCEGGCMTDAGYPYESAVLPAARRVESGFSNNVGWAILSKSLDLVLANRDTCAAQLSALAGDARVRLKAFEGLKTVGQAPHYFSLQCVGAKELHEHLKTCRVHCDLRHGGLRIAFGLYNSRGDVDRLVEAVQQWLTR